MKYKKERDGKKYQKIKKPTVNKASKKGECQKAKNNYSKKFSKDGERWRKKYTSVCVCESVYVCVDRFLRDWQNWPQPRCIIDSGHKTLDRVNVLLLIQVSQESEVGGFFFMQSYIYMVASARLANNTSRMYG